MALALLAVVVAALALPFDSSAATPKRDTFAQPSPGPRPGPVPQSLGPLTSIRGLGDSVPAGGACACTTFVALLAQFEAKAEHRPIAVLNEATGGLTSANLLHQVLAEGLTAPDRSATVITIGANDFDSGRLSTPGCRADNDLACYERRLHALSQNLTSVLRALVRTRQPHGLILVTGYWNVFLDGDVGAARGPDYVRDSDTLTRAVNTAVRQAAGANGGTYVDLYTPFKSRGRGETELLAQDGDHPSAAGHALIAALLEQAWQQALVRARDSAGRVTTCLQPRCGHAPVSLPASQEPSVEPRRGLWCCGHR